MMKARALLLAAGTLVLFLVGLAVLAALALGPLKGAAALGKPTVALLPMEGAIGAEPGFFGSGVDPEEMVERLQRAGDDAGIDAVVLLINSPGGSVVGSKRIVQAVRRLREKKPVVAWIGEVGASGAYYVAAAADYIYADEDSLTGSIGVVSEVHNYQGLLEKLGIKVEVLKEGRFKAMGSPFQPLGEEERRLLQALLEGVDRHFKRDVLAFRGERMDRARFEAVADGRILSGEQALQAGLIDAVGTQEDAVKKAGELAGFKEAPVTRRMGPREPTLFELLASAGYALGYGFKTGLAASAERAITLR